MFTRIALVKLNELIRRYDFIEISHIKADSVTVKFKDSTCTVSDFGKVEWCYN